MLWDEPKIFFLERRYFFSIILSEFLKNRVALQSPLPTPDLSGVMSKNRKQFKLVGVFHIVQTMKAIDFTQGNTPRTIVLTAYYFIIKQKLLPDTKK